MALEQFAYLAEILGVIVVAASLIFLAIQVRQNTVQIRVEGIAKGIETQVHRLSHLTDDAGKADLVRRGLASFGWLSQAEKGEVHTMFLDFCLAHNALRHAHGAGLLDQSEFRMHQHNWLSLMRTKGAREWFDGWKHMTPPDFQAYVAAAVDDPTMTVKPLDQEVPWLFRHGDVQSSA